MRGKGTVALIILLIFALPGFGQKNKAKTTEELSWERTREILKCAPRLVDRRDLVEDNFHHRYVTNNPRDIEVGYFSVEPITYFEEGKRVCEASLPAAGASQTHFRGTYITSYTLPGDGVYRVIFESNALVFSNDLRIINAQNTIASIDASHRIEIVCDSLNTPPRPGEERSQERPAYTWELDIDETGSWEAEIVSAGIEMIDHKAPSGFSNIRHSIDLHGPGEVVVRESVIFEIHSLSAYKYDPIFQASCLFSLEPLSISTKILPCEE